MVFQCIKISQVPWKVFKTAAFGLGFQHLPRDPANVNAWKTMFDPQSILLSPSWKASWKASVSIAENIMLNSVEASTQPCLLPFITGNGSENSPSYYRGSAAPLLWIWKDSHVFLKSLATDCIKCSCKVDKVHMEIHVLFLAFLWSCLLTPDRLSGRSPDC